MSEIINSTYDIIGKLGAGGGGEVYLAEHKRLGKKVVLKADKRSADTNITMLRREVDVLKELRNPYIPVVYDYFIENGTSYTVMDYVDGESMDKLLKRQKSFSPPEVIRWSKQLLNALAYLHSPTHGDPPRGYIHSDIKPANIMLRTNGDICLIDFNISLAIGIENVVGKSAGYSSPELYGLDYSFSGDTDATSIMSDTGKTELISDKTEYADNSEVRAEQNSSVSRSISSSFSKVIIPDARSDIYSMGAVMYHLLSGSKPARNAIDVVPLSEKEFPPLLVRIIKKAMEPNPDLRYASADDMLADIEGLWKNDPRVRRLKSRIAAGVSVFAVLLSLGGAAVFTGVKQTERIKEGQVLAAQSAEALSKGDVKTAADIALQALPENPGFFDIPYTPAAELALTSALGVYDLADTFKPHSAITLPSEPFRLEMSPDGRLLAAGYAYEIGIYDIDTGQLIRTLPTLESALCQAEFIDNNRIIYGGDKGVTVYDIAEDKILMCGENATAIAVSGDKTVAAAVYRDEDKVNLYNIASGELISSRSLEGKHLNVPENDRFADAFCDVFELNYDGSALAVSLSGGYLGILDMKGAGGDIVLLENSGYTKFSGGFTGNIFAFCANSSESSLFGMADYVKCEYLGSMEGVDPLSVKIYNDKLYVIQKDTAVLMDTETFEQTTAAYTENKNISAFDISDKYALSSYEGGWSVFYSGAGILQTEEREDAPDFVHITDNTVIIGNRNSPSVEILKRGDPPGSKSADIMNYDPLITHSEARLDAAKGSAMLFDIYGFTILEPDGSVRVSAALPEPDKIYDQQYRRGDGGDHLEVTYYSGKQVCYSAESGGIISETNTPPPDPELGEEFELSGYTVKAPLHGAPQVYDKETGKLVKELSGEDHLTYATQTGDSFVLQYISSESGDFYGILMNADWEAVARLPRLSDVCGGTLIFDLPGGCIRTSPVYGLSELRGMAEN